MDQAVKNQTDRVIGLKPEKTWKTIFFRWEWGILIILIILNLVNSGISANYLNYNNLASTLKMFLDKGIIAIPMMMVLLLGEIDISVASIMTLSGVLMGFAGSNDMPFLIIILIGLGSGLCCGLINGFLVAKIPELSSTIITLANMIFFRGIAYMIIENRAYMKFPPVMHFFAWGNVINIPFILIVFLLEVLIFTFVIHRTRFGRSLYAIGSNTTASYFSGVKTDNVKIIAYGLNGLFSGFSAMFLVSKLGSARASMAVGFEMEIIAMVILGGVAVTGGIGTVPGVFLAVFTIGLLRFGLGLINISAETIMIIIGLLLIVSVGLPNILLFIKNLPFVIRINKFLEHKK